MKKFEEPSVQVLRFELENIMTESDCASDWVCIEDYNMPHVPV